MESWGAVPHILTLFLHTHNSSTPPHPSPPNILNPVDMAYSSDKTNFSPMTYPARNFDGHPDWGLAPITEDASIPTFDTQANWPCDSIQQPAPILPNISFSRRWRQPPRGLTFDLRPSKNSVSSATPYLTQTNGYDQPSYQYPYPGEYLPGTQTQLQPADLSSLDGSFTTNVAFGAEVPSTCKNLSTSSSKK
jgi:hypothetical protein